MPDWGKYLTQLGLSEKVEVSKEDLKREADQAMKNAENILARARARGENGGR